MSSRVRLRREPLWLAPAIVVASAKAYVNALNKLILRRQRTAPDAKQVHYKDASSA